MQDVIILEGYAPLGFVKRLKKAVTPPKAISKALDVKAAAQTVQKAVTQAASGNVKAALQTVKAATKPPTHEIAAIGQQLIKYNPLVAAGQAAVQAARGEADKALQTLQTGAQGALESAKIAAAVVPGGQAVAAGIAAAEVAAKAAQGKPITPQEALAAGLKILPVANAVAPALAKVTETAKQVQDVVKQAQDIQRTVQTVHITKDPKEAIQHIALQQFSKKQPMLSQMISTAAKQTAAAGYAARSAQSKPVLREGSRGEAVKEWQRIIKITADGIFGSQTKAATIAFQKQRGLTPDGVVGPATWAAGLSTVPVVTPKGDLLPAPQPPVPPPPPVVVVHKMQPPKQDHKSEPVTITADVIDDGLTYPTLPAVSAGKSSQQTLSIMDSALEIVKHNWPFLAVAGVAAWYFLRKSDYERLI